MPSTSLSYRPEIDGLRAFAVIPVILFHFGLDWIPGGYIGVDVFFVISGFLITSILLKDYDQGVFSFSDFWLRRIRRILPVLVVIVLVTLIASQFLLYAPDIYYLGKQGIASLLSFANISQWLTAGNYWGYAAENSPLLHTWSLSVEEQFYLIFPLFIFIALKYFRNWLAPLVLVLCVLSALLFIYGTKNHPDATFYLLPTRAWELGVGAFLAIAVYKYPAFFQRKKSSTLQVLSLVGLCVVALSYFFIDGHDGISPLLILPVIGAGLIIVFASGSHTLVNKVLSIPAVVYVGKISYSLYLWHWPVLVLSKNLSLKTQTEYSIYLLLGLMLVLSIISYHLIEKPTRKNKKTVPVVLTVLVLGVIYSYTLTHSDYAEDISMYSQTQWDGELYNSSPSKEVMDATKRKMQGIKVSDNKGRNWQAYKEGGVVKHYGKDSPEIVVLGDSHALMWASTLDQIAKQLNKTIDFYAADGTPTFFKIPVTLGDRTIFFTAEEKRDYDEARLKYLQKWKPETVIITQSWSNLESVESTHDLIKFLGEIGSKVFLIEQPPELFYGDKNATQFLSHYGMKPREGEKQYVPFVNSALYQYGRKSVRDIVDACNYCELIEIADIYMKGDQGWVLDGSDVLYIDEDHLSSAGSSKAQQRIMQALDTRISTRISTQINTHQINTKAEYH
ncbi:acyltransferase family protein [Cocleimonas sp. KMM 6892]|uniref:acyltransferase family protein n=1 Tax=unclassified Cocleimonas TaxID=2639732 RepID=UPI002DBAEA08|nr:MULTISPECIES: acyltransferase family protein [unclassified Cocleimonas]MEB8433573.1 acyltransferase family protein [Cocleimonas sp. KMM 6892]MEC4716384.1 acyltransferase family protein [Cocleimonas sp. KMM 6895]MEC4745723.1 acyltransferase family protein [Cocleimonas sp. KMM 6896]